MKKLVFLLMLLFSMTVFAEKLTTDGKLNLDKLQGKWGNEYYVIQKKGNDWYLGVYNMNYSSNDEYLWYKMKKYKDTSFIISNFHSKETKVSDRNFYFAYDTKYKIMVELDKELNIVGKIPKKLNRPSN